MQQAMPWIPRVDVPPDGGYQLSEYIIDPSTACKRLLWRHQTQMMQDLCNPWPGTLHRSGRSRAV